MQEGIKLKSNNEYNYLFLKLLEELWPGDWQKQLSQMNKKIKFENISEVTEQEWWIFIGILIDAASLGKGGNKKMLDKGSKDYHEFCTPINFGTDRRDVITQNRFKTIKKFFTVAFSNPDKAN